MAGTFPTSPKPSKVRVEYVTSTQVDSTHSGRRNVRQFGAQRWRLSAKFPSTMSREQFMPIYGFLLKQDGQFGTFQFTSPDLAVPRGTATGTPLVNGASQTGTSIITDGWDNSISTLATGDILKFAGHNKVYMVTDDATSDGAGNSTIQIRPPLMESPGDNEAITVNGVAFTVQVAADISGYDVSGPLLYDFSLEMIEVI